MGAERDPFELCGVTIDGKYRVASVVGDGGFGVVYRGVHKGFGELIAIKCLKIPKELDEKGKGELLERLQDEGRLLHRLSKASSAIVQALDVGAFTTPSDVWVPYLVLEWLEGETLGDYLKGRIQRGDGGLSIVEAVKLLGPAARGLALAHAQKVAHRDVKPANLFLSEVGGKKTLKVLDFGIAKVIGEQTSFTAALESTGMAPTAFTPRYGAPEQFNKQRGASGPWTDVFALALVFVECVTGKRALEGDDPTQLYVASADPARRPTLRTRGAEATEAVEQVLKRALEIDPRDRYPDAGVFWSALEAAAGLEPTETQRRAAVSLASTAMSDEDPLLDTNDFAEKRKLGVKSESATVPVESLRSPRPKRPGSLPPNDPMAETPEGARHSRSAAVPSSRGKTNPIWAILAVVIFLGGAGFAYATFFSERPTRPNTTPSAPTPSVRPTSPVSATSVPPKPSSTASAPSPSVSGAPSAVPSGTPSPSAPDDMVLVRATTFAMGEAGIETTLTSDFYIDRYEVSVRAYNECVRARKCPKAEQVMGMSSSDPESFSKEWSARCNARRNEPDHPMNCVQLSAAEGYCAFREKRLPTEAEWELSARGKEGRKYPWGGGDAQCDTSCFDRNGGSCTRATEGIVTCAAGSHAEDRTPDLVYDMAGNVSEWTQDGFGDLLGGKDPVRKGGDARVVRGGNFAEGSEALLATHRAGFSAGAAHVTVGFRCAVSVPTAP